jgi:hypothetical protein
VLVLALAGCGASTVTVDEVPGGPVSLSLPAGADELKPAASATPTPTADASTATTDDAQPTPTPGASQTQPPADTTQGTTDGAAQDPGTDDTQTTDQPPPAGSPADQFEDYCAQNPGAC